MTVPTTPTITIYKNDTNNTIFVEGSYVGNQFTDTLEARTFDLVEETLSIQDTSTEKDIFSNIIYTRFLKQNGDPYGNTLTDVINELNTVFRATGTPNTDLPRITSSLSIPITRGDTINYELIADKGVGYEWNNLPSGVVTVEGNVRKLIGGSGLSTGTYTTEAAAINYNGEDRQNIDIIVSNPPYNNTKSINFPNTGYISATLPSMLQSTLGRVGNGSGSNDAWTIALYFKAGTSNNIDQKIFYFGDNDLNNGNHCYLRYDGSTNDMNLRFRYGSNNNNLELQTPDNSISDQVWHHILISYDGGTTGSSSGDINDYYSRFKIFIDGIQQTTNNSNGNFGTTTSLTLDEFRVGRYLFGNNLRNSCRVDELAIWDSDQSSNVSSIYNAGVPFDYTNLATQPTMWSRFGDGDTYPILNDNIGSVMLMMNSMTSADIVNDVP